MNVTIPFGSNIYPLSSIKRLMGHIKPFLETIWGAEGRPFGDRVLAAADAHPELAEFFQIGTAPQQEFGLKEPYLYPTANPIVQLDFLSITQQVRALDMERFGSVLWPEVHKILHRCGSGVYLYQHVRDHLEAPMDDFLDELLADGFVRHADRPKPAFDPHGFGVYRLQHAALLFRSPTAGVLVDPHLHSDYEPETLTANITRSQLEGWVDAILISHSHGDHWNLPSLLMFPLDTPIVVPKVSRASLLCEDMRQQLEGLGFTNVHTPEWYGEPLRIKDIEIHVLPFYGEQPMLGEANRDPDLRNWGNTYYLRTEAYTSWVIIDSGDDVTGSMRDVAAYLNQTFGAVDFLFSNLREFQIHRPTYITGDGRYWLSLTPEQMANFARFGAQSITLGPDKVAELCRIAEVRHFLPYAHWWANPGETGGDQELALLEQLQAAIKKNSIMTHITPWHIGDGFIQKHNQFQTIPWPLARSKT